MQFVSEEVRHKLKFCLKNVRLQFLSLRKSIKNYYGLDLPNSSQTCSSKPYFADKQKIYAKALDYVLASITKKKYYYVLKSQNRKNKSDCKKQDLKHKLNLVIMPSLEWIQEHDFCVWQTYSVTMIKIWLIKANNQLFE